MRGGVGWGGGGGQVGLGALGMFGRAQGAAGVVCYMDGWAGLQIQSAQRAKAETPNTKP